MTLLCSIGVEVALSLLCEVERVGVPIFGGHVVGWWFSSGRIGKCFEMGFQRELGNGLCLWKETRGTQKFLFMKGWGAMMKE
jgi:hypothetical protein